MTARAAPYLRLLGPFAIALGIGGCYDLHLPWLGAFLIGSAPLLFLLAGWSFPYRFRWVYGLLFSTWLFGFGWFHVEQFNELRQDGHFAGSVPQAHYLVGTICEAPSRGSKLKVPLQVEAIGTAPDSLLPYTGHLLLFLDITEQSDSLHYGDRLGICTTIRPTEPPKNPYAFDYSRYLHFQNIHFQAFVKPDSLIHLSTGHGFALWRLAYGCRDRLLALLREHFSTQDEYAVASALLVGYTDDLSEDLRSAYAETGSMHALAVSGTHVGMIYVGIMFFLSRLPLRGRFGKLIETLLALLGIWSFTFLTGATASVLRASVMFSLFLLGKLIFRNASIWNILALSACGLLVYNPYLLFNAGFQLSYAAVAGMVYFYPYFNKWMPDWPKPLGEFRSIFLIGFAAQLGTLPLSLFFFHQFPVYFWLAGWVVVLGGAIFLAGGAALVVLDPLWHGLANGLGFLLYYLVWGMNQVVFFIQHLPGSVIGGIWLPAWATALLYVLVAFLAATVSTRQLKWAVAALGVFTVLGFCRLARSYGQEKQQELVIYSLSKRRLLDIFDGTTVFSLADSLTKKQIVFAAQPNRWALGMRSLSTEPLNRDSILQTDNCCFYPPFLLFSGKKMVIIDQARWLNNASSPPMPVDFILLSNNPKITIAECLRQFPCPVIIWDSTNSWKQCERWQSECLALGLDGHDIRQQGAFIWKNN